jgi:hypothetical protein
MTHEFSQSEWQEVGDTFIMSLKVTEPFDKPIIQIYKYSDTEHVAAGLVLPKLLSVIQNDTIFIQCREAFEGYIVVK